jgi:hypothetical protein
MEQEKKRAFQKAIRGVTGGNQRRSLMRQLLEEPDDPDRQALLEQLRNSPRVEDPTSRGNRFVWGPGDIRIIKDRVRGTSLPDARTENPPQGDPNDERYRDFARLLASGETIESSFHLGHGDLLYTNWRLIWVHEHGLTGSKVEYRSVPYQRIVQFSVKARRSFDLAAKLCVYLSGGEMVEVDFTPEQNVYEAQAWLAGHIHRLNRS